jgi:branched-subunit amino acid ABC-type transport system permease component
MLGPAIGYALASLCLKFYISPTLTPTIGTDDPRWLGAWWFGKFWTRLRQSEMVQLVTFFIASLICAHITVCLDTKRTGKKMHVS